MHPLYLVNEGTVAVITMTVALFVAFGMVIALGAYVIYCDRLNRAEQARLVHAEGTEPADEPAPAASPAPTAEPDHPARRRRAEPPSGH